MIRKVLAGIAVGAAFAAGTVAPAFAVTVDGTDWSLSMGDFGVNQFDNVQDTAPYGAYSGDGISLFLEDPSNAGSYLSFNCNNDTETTQDDGDVIVTCDDPTDLLSGDLVWDGDVTIFSGDYRGLVGRIVYTLSNTTSSPLTLDLRFEADTEECDGGSGNIATSSGDLDTDTGDSWLLCNNDNKAIEGFAWGNNWMNSFVTDDALNSCDVCDFDNDGYVLAANSTVTLVFFLYSEGSLDDSASYGDTNANIIANATSYFDVTTLGASRLWENLTTADNWNNVSSSAAETPSLPNTGVDVSGLLIAGLAIVGLGAVIVMRRRSAKA